MMQMTARRCALGVASLAATFALSALPGAARAQSPADTNQLKADLALAESQVKELEDIKSKIEADSHVLVLDPAGAAVFLEVDRVESLFVTRLMEGSMNAQQAAETARGIGTSTRIYLNDIIAPDLKKAIDSRDRLAERLRQARNPDTTPVREGIAWPVGSPMDWSKVVATIRGVYRFECQHERAGVSGPVVGTFRLELLGNGYVAGTYETSDAQWPVDGSIYADGIARGEGGNPDGRFFWMTQFVRDGNYLQMADVKATFAPSFPGATCGPGMLVVTRSGPS